MVACSITCRKKMAFLLWESSQCLFNQWYEEHHMSWNFTLTLTPETCYFTCIWTFWLERFPIPPENLPQKHLPKLNIPDLFPCWINSSATNQVVGSEQRQKFCVVSWERLKYKNTASVYSLTAKWTCVFIQAGVIHVVIVLRCGQVPEQRNIQCVQRVPVVRNIPFTLISFVLSLPFLSFMEEELRDGTTSPLRDLVLHRYL